MQKRLHAGGGLDSEGTSAYAQADYARAEELLLAAVKVAEGFEGNDLRLCKSLDNLAKVKEAQEGYEEAAALYERSLDIKESAVGSGHPEHLKGLTQLSQFYLSLGERTRAEQLAELLWCMASFGPAATPEAISKAYESSLQLQTRILALKESALGPNHADVAYTVHNIASLNFTREDYAAAEQLGSRHLKIMEVLYGPEDRMLGSALEHLTKIYQAQGNSSEAEAYQKRFEKVIGVLTPAGQQEQGDIGRFLQPDPIGYKDNLNLYTYAKNDPLQFTDVFGLTAGPKTGGESVHKAGNSGTPPGPPPPTPPPPPPPKPGNRGGDEPPTFPPPPRPGGNRGGGPPSPSPPPPGPGGWRPL